MEKDNPGVIMLPPMLYLSFLLLGGLLEFIMPAYIHENMGETLLGIVLTLAGIVITVFAGGQFEKEGTNIRPNLPATKLVEDGLYRYSRNPMYVGLTFVYFGLAFAFDSLWILLLAAPLIGIMHYGVILREEKYMEKKFGQPYLDFRKRVRRWL